MNEYLALLFPALAGILLLFFFKHKTTWWEVLLPVIVGVIVIFSMRSCDKAYLIADTEYRSHMAYTAKYEEPWNEYIKKTCSHTTCTGSGKNRSCTTIYYDCSYVKYHEAEYYIEDSDGNVFYISESEYNKIVKKWHNQHFVELNRNYHSIDGDMYVTQWTGKLDELVTTHTSHSYENRVQASHSVYNFKEVPEEEAIKNKLYEYPKIQGYSMNPILSNDITIYQSQQDKLNIINGMLGKKKQIQVFVLLWKDKPYSISELQRAYWKGGNKNELIINIGLDKNNKIEWNNIYSWSDKQLAQIKIRDWLSNQKGKKLNIKNLTHYSFTAINKHWVRKNFKEFDYLEVDLTKGQVRWIYIVVIIFTLGLCIFAVMNDKDPVYKESTGNQKLLIFKQRVFDYLKSKLKPITDRIKLFFNWIKSKLYW